MVSDVNTAETALLPESPAHGFIKQACRIVGCVLSQSKLPETMANLVAALSHLDGDELSRHAGVR